MSWKERDMLHHDIIANEIYDQTVGPAWDVSYAPITIERWVLELRKLDSKRVLEYGCGTGECVLHLVRNGCQVVAIDYSRNMLKKTRQKVSTLEHSDVDYVQADGESLPFKDNSFDSVTCRWVLHHIPDVERAVSEISRVLCHGGTVYVAEVSSQVGFVERRLNAMMNLGIESLHRLTSDAFNRLKVYESLPPSSERPIDPDLIETSFRRSDIDANVRHIPHLPVYLYLPSSMSRKITPLLESYARKVNLKKALVVILEGRKK